MQDIIEEYNNIYNEIKSLHYQHYDHPHIHLAFIELKVQAYHDTMDILDMSYNDDQEYNNPVDEICVMMDCFVKEAEMHRDNIDEDIHYMFTPKGKEVINDLINAMGSSLEFLEKVHIENNEFMTDEEISQIEFDFPQRKDG